MVNDQEILVEPTTRRIVEVIDAAAIASTRAHYPERKSWRHKA
jgi:hypothetical protein